MKAIISTIVALLIAIAASEEASSGGSSGYTSSSSNVYGSSSSSSSSSSNNGKTNNNYYGRSGAYGQNLFAESSSTSYDGYQQAWRYLGWYVKCGYPSDRYNEGSGDHNSHSGDKNSWVGNNYCQRYLIWAAVSPSMGI